MQVTKPITKPENPCFSSGPCAKRKGWSPAIFNSPLAGRSHRSKEGKAALKKAIDETRSLLGIPADYHIGIVPASDTGAIEMAMWSMLGARGVTSLVWDSFGLDWAKDITDELRLPNAKIIKAPYGEIPDLTKIDFNDDLVFLWNGTTSGACLPNADWIDSGRAGLTFCDATSAVFAMDMDWQKLDVTTFSWQKVLGGEAAHGILILSPRAVERLETFKPDRALPKIFRMVKDGKFQADIFEGVTINTPSMLCVVDYLDALAWVRQLGGLQAVMQKSRDNLAVLENWVAQCDWVDFLAADKSTRSNTSVCLKITAPWFENLDEESRWDVVKTFVNLIEAEGAGYDFKGYMKAPAGLRIWCGATVEASDIAAFIPWLEWAYNQIENQYAKAA